MNRTIHTGNYEEFFILYMDGELTAEEMKEVDAFLATHPDLQAEFDLLMGTKLPVEPVFFDKTELMADRMKLTVVDEDLLLYIDNELPAPQAKELERKIAAGGELALQHSLLQRTKLDAAEIVPCPRKEELYHRSERVVLFRPWMRVAAAVALIAVSGVFYFRSSGPATTQDPVTAPAGGSIAQVQPKQNPSTTGTQPAQDAMAAQSQQAPAEHNEVAAVSNHKVNTVRVPRNDAPVTEKNQIALQTPDPKDVPTEYTDNKRRPDAVNTVSQLNSALNFTETVKGAVTIVASDRINSIASVTPAATGSDIEDNTRKGSFKGFLRKATKVIEKRTGINPTNDDGELLIGAVAVKLN